MKKILIIVLLSLLVLSGCQENDSKTTNKENINNISENNKENEENSEILSYQSKLDEYDKIINDLNEKISLLNENISNLQKENETLKNQVSNNKNDLQKLNSLINKNNSSKNTITKEALLNETWVSNIGEKTFNKDLVNDIIGNWIIYRGSAIYYEVIDGKLYLTDDGPIYIKK